MKRKFMGLTAGAVMTISAISLLISATGCSSLSQPYSSSFASVIINDVPEEEIHAATSRVFAEAGYRLAGEMDGFMVFEREGSRMDQAAYGSAISDVPVWTRVRVNVVPFTGGAQRLQCQAYIVRDYRGPHEEEIRLYKPRSRPYHNLLEQVAERCARNK